MAYELSSEMNNVLNNIESAGFDTTDIRSEINSLITDYEDTLSEKDHELELKSHLMQNLKEEIKETEKKHDKEMQEKEEHYMAHFNQWVKMKEDYEEKQQNNNKRSRFITAAISGAIGAAGGFIIACRLTK